MFLGLWAGLNCISGINRCFFRPALWALRPGEAELLPGSGCSPDRPEDAERRGSCRLLPRGLPSRFLRQTGSEAPRTWLQTVSNIVSSDWGRSERGFHPFFFFISSMFGSNVSWCWGWEEDGGHRSSVLSVMRGHCVYQSMDHKGQMCAHHQGLMRMETSWACCSIMEATSASAAPLFKMNCSLNRVN